MTIIRARGTTAGAGPVVSTSPFDQEIAGLGSLVFCAMKASNRVTASPKDRQRDTAWFGRSTGVPTVTANDARFGHDSLRYTDVPNASTILPKNGPFPASYTIGLVWAPDVNPVTTSNIGTLALMGTGGGTAPYGAYLFSTTANRLSLAPQFGSGTGQANLDGRVVNGLNVTFASVDASTEGPTSRTVALYCNSRTAAIGTGGPPTAYPAPVLAQDINIGGSGLSVNDQAKISIGAAFLLTRPLHNDSTGALIARTLMEAAVRTYGLTLV